MPEQSNRSFDRILGRVDVDTLKRIVRLFGGKSTWRKDECIAFLTTAYKDPNRIASVVKLLGEHEYNMLAFTKWMGGEIDSNLLKIALYASGTRIPGARYGYLDPFDDALQKFVRSGLIFNRIDYGSPATLRSYHSTADYLYSDDRVLAHIGEPRVSPAALAFIPEPPAVRSRAPHLITMQVISTLNQIEALHGLKLTKSGEVHVADLRKISKALDYPDGNFTEGGFVLPNAAALMINVLRGCGVLNKKGALLLPTELAEKFLTLPTPEQVRMLVDGVLRSPLWQETGRFHYGYYLQNLTQARFALLILLQSLPADRPGMVRANELDEALFQRIGEHFKLLSFAPRYYSYEKDHKNEQVKYIRWLAEQRNEWEKTERIWLEEALKTWLYFFGIVALDMDQDMPAAVGLTDLGRAVLHRAGYDEAAQRGSAPDEPQLAWVVQPNFDVIAYLDHLQTAQLSFLERNAERASTSDHVAEYRITRDSVYRGLESGLSVESILDSWQRGSGRELPQNVVVEIREWAALREKMVLYRQADLAEFPSSEARQAALNRGISGQPVGERFLLITQPLSKAQVKLFYSTLDYSRPPQRSLVVAEDGVVIMNSDHSDLVLAARLNEWTDLDEAGNPQFTKERVRRAIDSGRSITTLYKLLEERLTRMLPPIFQVALRAWAGETIDVSLEDVVVLYAPSPEISYAIQNSALIRPYLRAVLAHGYFLVNRDHAQALQEQLAAFGLGVQTASMP